MRISASCVKSGIIFNHTVMQKDRPTMNLYLQCYRDLPRVPGLGGLSLPSSPRMQLLENCPKSHLTHLHY